MSKYERTTVVKLKSSFNGVSQLSFFIKHVCTTEHSIIDSYVCITAIHNMTYENNVISKNY